MPKTICPETEMHVVLPASEIPDGATVTKRHGEMRMLLRHQLTVYGYKPAEGDPAPTGTTEELFGSKTPKLEIKGYYLIGPNGSINQVEPGKRLVWCVAAEDLIAALERSWLVEEK